MLRVGAEMQTEPEKIMEIDQEFTEKTAKNTQRWWKSTATICAKFCYAASNG